MPSLNDLLGRLAESGIEFVIVGGYAGTLHGSALVTRDLDICAVLTPENVGRLRKALADLNPVHRMTPQRLSFMSVPAQGEPVQNLYLDTDWGTIDIISSVLGLGDFSRVNDPAETIAIKGRPIRLLSLEDLIESKLALGREKDLLAAKELRAIAAKRNRPGSRD